MSDFKLKDKRKEQHLIICYIVYSQDIRKERKLSRRELAEQSGVHEQTIRFLEEEINDPQDAKLSTLTKLAKALHCKVRDFYPCDKNI